MKSILYRGALLIAARCLVITGVQGASIEERFLPHFMLSDDISTATAVSVANVSSSTAAAAGEAVNDSPVVISQGSPGKKIQITITKEITGLHGHNHGVGTGSHAAAMGHANATAAHAPHGHGTGHMAAAARHPPHGAQVLSAPAQLQLNNAPLVVDNETMADLLQQMLAGNLQNIETHGRPLAVPPGGKPVAVIFSSSMHVVDLGDLRPPPTAAPVTTPRPRTHAPHRPHNANVHTAHNATHGAHPGMDHASLLASIMSPLLSLTHLGASHGEARPPVHQPVATATQAPVPVQAMQMQPVIMMMPVSTGQLQALPVPSVSAISSGPSVPVHSSPDLSGVLEGILAAKQQLLNSTLLADHGPPHAGHHAHVASAPAHASPTAHVSAPPPVVQTASAPVVVVQEPKRVKKIDINISKTKVF